MCSKHMLLLEVRLGSIFLHLEGTPPLPHLRLLNLFKDRPPTHTCSLDQTIGLEKSNVAKQNRPEAKSLKTYIFLIFFPTFGDILSSYEEGKSYLVRHIDQLKKGLRFSLHGKFSTESFCLVYCFTSLAI